MASGRLAGDASHRANVSYFLGPLVFGYFPLAFLGLIVGLLMGWLCCALADPVVVLRAAKLGFGLRICSVPVCRHGDSALWVKHVPVPVAVGQVMLAVPPMVLVLMTTLAVAAGGA